MRYTSSGVVESFPVAKTIERRPDSWWMVLQCDEELARYYRRLYDLRQYGLPPRAPLQSPPWGAHITIVRNEKPSKPELWKKWQDWRIPFSYDSEIKGYKDYLWLNVQCEKLLDIREELGLPRFPEFSLHLTIGRRFWYLPDDYPVDFTGTVRVSK